MKTYAGIGSRQTPSDILSLMSLTAKALAIDGYTLNTGACKGADQAFAEGAVSSNGNVNLMLPWNTYEAGWSIGIAHSGTVRTTVFDKAVHGEAEASVNLYHPAPHRLSQGVRKLHARNYLIVDGVDFIICWTPGGEITGGTGMALRIAKSKNIPVYNFGNENVKQAFIVRLKERNLL